MLQHDASVAEIRLYTLGDLGDKHVIFALCGPCGRSVKLSTARLAAVYGAALTINQLKRRLACTECGVRRREIRIVFALPQSGEGVSKR